MALVSPFYGVKLTEQGCEQRLVDLVYPHLPARVLDRHAHSFAAGRLVAEFHLAHVVGVEVEPIAAVNGIGI